jgi:glycerol-3-phosphate acyltransferase PlsX
MKIGLDVMGGDKAPKSTIEGAILAQQGLSPSDKIVLIGNQDIIISYLNKANINPSIFEIVNAPEKIEMGEQPVKAYSKKQNSSIVIGFRLLRDKKIDAFASAGNTGAMLIGPIYNINVIKGIIRPCTAGLLPKENGGNSIILDVGTNPDCKPDVLYQFGILGSLYAKYVYNIKNPKVGLLNIGEESEKGNLLSQSSFKLMKKSKDFNFVGNVEGRDLFKDKLDVIVCDGFVGNIVIKQTEAIYHIMDKRGLVDNYFKRFNYENYGGTPILGIESTVVVGHGISSAEAIKNMILLSKNIYKAKLSDKIKNILSINMF